MNIQNAQEKIIEDVSKHNEWFDTYEFIIDQAKKLEPMPDNLKTEQNQVRGCQSKVWIHAKKNKDVINFIADSDTIITKGLIALLLQVLNNQTADSIIKADLFFLKKAGLSTNLSPSRANGLVSIVNKMKDLAKTFI